MVYNMNIHGTTLPTHHQVFILNGPPHCGKDTMANIMEKLYKRVRLRKFATPLKDAVGHLFGIPHDLQRSLDKVGSTLKDTPLEVLHGKSWREACIWMSEEVAKPRYGKKFFGQVAVRKLIDAPTISVATVFSDGGFPEELDPIGEYFGWENIHVVTIIRPGTSFQGDSRRYLTPADLPREVHFHRLENTVKLSELRYEVVKITDPVFGMDPSARVNAGVAL